MAHQVVQLKCPACGAPVVLDQEICDYCEGPVIITDLRTLSQVPEEKMLRYEKSYEKQISDNPGASRFTASLAFCYMRRKNYDKAIDTFEKVIDNDFDNAEAYFNLAICLLKGKKPFCHMRPVIDKILEYVNTAISIEGKGIYYYFLAYIKYDYFARKYLNTSPNYKDLLAKAKQVGYSQFDARQLFLQLGVDRPAGF